MHQGDPLPQALRQFWDDVEGGRTDGAAACFAPDGVFAVPPALADETASRAVAVGPAADRRSIAR